MSIRYFVLVSLGILGVFSQPTFNALGAQNTPKASGVKGAQNLALSCLLVLPICTGAFLFGQSLPVGANSQPPAGGPTSAPASLKALGSFGLQESSPGQVAWDGFDSPLGTVEGEEQKPTPVNPGYETMGYVGSERVTGGQDMARAPDLAWTRPELTELKGHASSAKGPGSQGIVVFFGGYLARLSDVQQWGEQALMVPALGGRARQVWVFKGPDSQHYRNQYLPMEAFAQILSREAQGEPITIISHSRGALVATHFVAEAKDRGLGSQLHVYTLDGPPNVNLSELKYGVARSVGVWAKSPTGKESLGARAMKGFPETFVITCHGPHCEDDIALHCATLTPEPTSRFTQNYWMPSALQGVFETTGAMPVGP